MVPGNEALGLWWRASELFFLLFCLPPSISLLFSSLRCPMEHSWKSAHAVRLACLQTSVSPSSAPS